MTILQNYTQWSNWTFYNIILNMYTSFKCNVHNKHRTHVTFISIKYKPKSAALGDVLCVPIFMFLTQSERVCA